MPHVEEYLAARGITPEVAELAGLFEVPDAHDVYPDFRHAPALVLPYLDIRGEPVPFERDGEALPFCRVRYMGDLAPQRGRKKPLRYTQPADSGCRAYFPPGADWAAIAANPDEPVMVTEGEIKGLAVTTYVAPCIGLGGVSSTVRDGQFLPELAEFAWEGREVYICFDSDAADNPKVTAAEARLVEELQTKRGARCRLMRIPPGSDGAKVGIDDYLVAHGADAVLRLVADAQDLYALDAKVIALNRSCAWIESEGLIYDLEARTWITKDNFVNGGRFSTLRHYVPAKKGGDVKAVQVAKTWLTHAHAQRFADVLFRPGEGEVVTGDAGQQCLNLWTGWEERPGDVAPWLDLTAFLFQTMEPADRELPVKLLAYKFQNPQEKVPLATVLIGPEGCGKSLWAECVGEAFGAYGTVIKSSDLNGQFQGWLEHSLFVNVNEAEEWDMFKAKDAIKSLVSDKRCNMNEKYRKARQIDSFCMINLTSNNRAVGSFSREARRFIVVDCPPKQPIEFYDRIKAWKRGGGPKALAHYLLNLDLASWEPPAQAPMTAEKYMAYVEGLSPIQKFAEDCQSNGENAVKQWLDAARAWGEVSVTSSNPATASAARAVLDAAPQWQVRPFYTPEELLLMLPTLVEQMGAGRVGKRTTSGELSRQLRDAGIRYLVCKDDPRGFRWKGKLHQFLVIAEMSEWTAPLSQDEFDRCMAQFPRYSQIRAKRAAE